MARENERMLKVLSVHWGFSVGGVAQYAAVIERVKDVAPIEMSTLCILSRRRHVDERTLAQLGNLVIVERRGPLDLRWISELARYLELRRPDLVMTHGFNGHFALSIVALLRRGNPRMVASYHGEYHPPSRVKALLAPLYNAFTEFYMRQSVRSIVSVAEHCQRHLVSRGVPANKVRTIHNGIPDVGDVQDPAALRRELGLPHQALVIGTASRLDPEKGITYLLRAFEKVAGEHRDAVLAIVGTGSQEGALRDLAATLGIAERVHFTGFRSGAGRLFGAFDIFALPSLAEYHSIGLLEAMRAGCAIVATDVGGNTESVSDRRQGLIVAPGDENSLAQALQTLLADGGLRRSLGMAARERFLREFTVEAMIRDTANWLQEAAG